MTMAASAGTGELSGIRSVFSCDGCGEFTWVDSDYLGLCPLCGCSKVRPGSWVDWIERLGLIGDAVVIVREYEF